MKYIIEIEDTPYTEDTSEIELYKATNFNSLVFDQNGLDKLEKFETTSMIDKSNFSEEQYRSDIENAHDCGYQEGYDTAIENAQATKLDWGEVQYNKGIADLVHAMQVYEDTSAEERFEYYGTNIWAYQYAIDNPTELIAMAKAYEEKKKAEEETIKVGDEVEHKVNSTIPSKLIVTEVKKENSFMSGISHLGEVYSVMNMSQWRKTGRHFNEVSQLLDKLRGE